MKMSKQDLKNLIDLLPENDTDTIYKVLIKFIPESEPLPDELDIIEQGKKEIASGEYQELKNIKWD